MTLFEIGREFAEINELLAETGGELTPDIEARVTAWIESLSTEEGRKLDGYAAYVKRLEMEAAAAQAERDQWARRADSRLKAAKRLKDRVRDYLIESGRTKVSTEKGLTISVQQNGGKVPLEVDTIDPATVPDDLCRVVRTVDSEAVRSALESGESLPWARFGERGSHLRIRI